MAIFEFLLPIHRFGSKLRMLVVMNTLSPTSLHFSFLTWEYFHHTLMADSCIIALENRINLGVIWCPLVLTFPWWLRWYRICLQCGRPRFIPGVGKILWRRDRLPTPVFLPGEFHGQRNLAGYCPRGHKSWMMMSNKHFHFSVGY